LHFVVPRVFAPFVLLDVFDRGVSYPSVTSLTCAYAWTLSSFENLLKSADFLYFLTDEFFVAQIKMLSFGKEDGKGTYMCRYF